MPLPPSPPSKGLGGGRGGDTMGGGGGGCRPPAGTIYTYGVVFRVNGPPLWYGGVGPPVWYTYTVYTLSTLQKPPSTPQGGISTHFFLCIICILSIYYTIYIYTLYILTLIMYRLYTLYTLPQYYKPPPHHRGREPIHYHNTTNRPHTLAGVEFLYYHLPWEGGDQPTLQ